MTELRGKFKSDNEGDMRLVDVFHGFGVSRESAKEGDRSSVGVTEAPEKEGEVKMKEERSRTPA